MIVAGSVTSIGRQPICTVFDLISIFCCYEYDDLDSWVLTVEADPAPPLTFLTLRFCLLASLAIRCFLIALSAPLLASSCVAAYLESATPTSN